MVSIIIGTIILGIIRALIPSHWLPLVAVAKVEKWKQSDLMMNAAIAGIAHIIGTVLLGVIFGYAGNTLAQKYETFVHIAIPFLIILLGVIFFVIPFFRNKRVDDIGSSDSEKENRKWIVGFAIVMFLSPCLEVQSLFIAAGSLGKDNIFLLAQIYALVSLTVIMLLTYLAYKGISFLENDFVLRNSQWIAGIVLIVVGVVTFIIH